MENKNWKCRIAPSLGGGFEGTPESAWGTEEYGAGGVDHSNLSVVFFGLYGLPDFFTLWNHKGKKACLWAGSDITHFLNGYWLDEKGKIKISPKSLAIWINNYVDNYVENEVEQVALAKLGIESKVVPSFLGNVNDFPLSFKPQEKIKLYTSVSGNDFNTYGWNKIYKFAQDNPDIDFYLYGNTIPFPIPEGFVNIFIRGRMEKEEMNSEIKQMTGALRLTEFDGFSELIAKSLLWGQWPVSIIYYPGTIRVECIKYLKDFIKKPNKTGREWLIKSLNKYPWNIK